MQITHDPHSRIEATYVLISLDLLRFLAIYKVIYRRSLSQRAQYYTPH